MQIYQINFMDEKIDDGGEKGWARKEEKTPVSAVDGSVDPCLPPLSLHPSPLPSHSNPFSPSSKRQMEVGGGDEILKRRTVRWPHLFLSVAVIPGEQREGTVPVLSLSGLVLCFANTVPGAGWCWRG